MDGDPEGVAADVSKWSEFHEWWAVTEADVIERLEAISAVVALVDTRVYAVKIPQAATLPAIRVQLISPPIEQHLRGPSYPAQYRFQVDCVAQENSGADWLGDVQSLAAAVRGDGLGPAASGLFGWVGVLGGSPAVISVRNVELEHNGTVEYMPDELRQVRIRQDYMFHWSPMS
jgi:hypothetical protein